MTYEKAYKECKEFFDNDGIGELDAIAFNMALNALGKQIPKKPIRAHRIIKKNGMFILRDDNEYWKCPICTKADVVLLKNQKHCHDCGQALDWSDTE
jgi:hypothetical protein